MTTARSSLSIKHILLIAACIAGFAAASVASAQSDAVDDIDWKKGVWSDLIPTLGTYNYDKVLKDPRVKAKLDALLKDQKIDLAKQFEVNAPIGFENDCLILQGNPAHMGDTNAIYLNACVSQGDVYIAAFDKGKITVYAKTDGFQYLPNGLRTWVYLQSNEAIDLNKKPENVQLMVQAK